MDEEYDSEFSEKSQEAEPASTANVPVPAAQTRTLRSTGDSAPSVQTHLSHEEPPRGSTEKQDGVETPAALDADGLKESEILSGECLAREPLLNEHFNNPLPQISQYTVSRAELADGGAGRILGPTGQKRVSISEPVQDDSDSAVDECPICTDSYCSQGNRSMALLNCGHSVCQRCLATMLGRAADRSRVQCPLCRQKTPLLQWEVYRLQEDMAFCTVPPPSSTPGPEPPAEPPGPGLCSTLGQRLLHRAETAHVCGCFPHPRWLMQLIRRMQHQHHCYCCYITSLVIMFLAELTFLCLVFLPIVVLVLLFTLGS